MSGIFAKITVFVVIFIDFLDGFCNNSNIASYCVEAFDPPGRHGVRPAEMVRGIVTEPLSRGPTTRRSCLKRMWPEGR